jgi:hypothetical protein
LLTLKTVCKKIKKMTPAQKKTMKDLTKALNDAKDFVAFANNGVYFNASTPEKRELYFIKERTVTVDGIDVYEYRPRIQK